MYGNTLLHIFSDSRSFASDPMCSATHFFAIVNGCFDQHYIMQDLRCFVSIQAGNADDAIEECKYLESKGMILYHNRIFVVPSEKLLLKKNIMVRN